MEEILQRTDSAWAAATQAILTIDLGTITPHGADYWGPLMGVFVMSHGSLFGAVGNTKVVLASSMTLIIWGVQILWRLAPPWTVIDPDAYLMYFARVWPSSLLLPISLLG